jgi:hypothetical protein
MKPVGDVGPDELQLAVLEARGTKVIVSLLGLLNLVPITSD